MSATSVPSVSICLTTYNRAETLHLTIESILKQSFSDFELIISDDNSTDKTKEVCEEYARNDKRIRYFRNNQNLKMPGNLNKAISLCNGNYIANLHDGDIYRPELISKWFGLLKTYPDAAFVFNQYNELDEKGNHRVIHDHKLKECNDGVVLYEYFLRTLTSAPWGTVMARKSYYLEYGLFNAKYGFISDVEMWLRLGLHGKVCYVNEPLIELTPRERTHTYFLPHWRVFCINLIIIFEYYPRYIKLYPYLVAAYPLKSIFRQIEKQIINNLMILLKHLDFERFREGLGICKKLPLKNSRLLGGIFGIAGKISSKNLDVVNELTNKIEFVKNL